MAEKTTSDTGVWVDRTTGAVVTKQPVSGVQLVPPGGELRPDRKAAIEAAKEAAKPVETATAAPVETATVPNVPKKAAARKG